MMSILSVIWTWFPKLLLAFLVNRSTQKSLQKQVCSLYRKVLKHKSIHDSPWLAIYYNHRFDPCSPHTFLAVLVKLISIVVQLLQIFVGLNGPCSVILMKVGGRYKTSHLTMSPRRLARYELAAHIMCAASCYTCSICMAVTARVYKMHEQLA